LGVDAEDQVKIEGLSYKVRPRRCYISINTG